MLMPLRLRNDAESQMVGNDGHKGLVHVYGENSPETQALIVSDVSEKGGLSAPISNAT